MVNARPVKLVWTHVCAPPMMPLPRGSEPAAPRGTAWRCRCGRLWVVRNTGFLGLIKEWREATWWQRILRWRAQ